MFRLLVVGILAAVLGTAALGCVNEGRQVRAPAQPTRVDPPEQIADFGLLDQERRPVRLSDQRGRVVLVFFGFTNCTDACPVTVASWQRVADLLGEGARETRFIFISVDPERDSPEQLRNFLGGFNRGFVGLTGSLEELETASAAFLAPFRKVPRRQPADDGSYLVAHPEVTYALDREGRLRMVFPLGTPPETITTEVRLLLRAP